MSTEDSARNGEEVRVAGLSVPVAPAPRIRLSARMPEPRLTGFGAVILRLMLSRGMWEWTALSSAMAEKGHDFKPPRISNWGYGRHAVDHSFLRPFSETLGVDEDERTILAIAFAYGQDRYPDETSVMRSSNGRCEMAVGPPPRSARMGRDRPHSPTSMVGCIPRWVKTRIDAHSSEEVGQHGRHRQEDQRSGDEGR